MPMFAFSLLEGVDRFSITHPFSHFRFCVINHVSAPKLLTLVSGYKKGPFTVPYSELCHHLWDSLAPSVHTLLYTTAGPRQFCALPSECLALLQCQHLNLFVCQTSPVVDMLSAQVTTRQHLPATVESHALYMPVFVLHTPSPTGSGSSLV
jgi:hypothetical protein